MSAFDNFLFSQRLNILKHWICCYVPLFVDGPVTVSGMVVNGHKLVVCTRPRSKLKHSKTAAPTELLLVTIDDTMVHLFCSGSYFSTEFNDEDPSLPPRAYKNPSTSITSWVDRLECIAVIGSHAFRRIFNRSPLDLLKISQMWQKHFQITLFSYTCTWFHHCRQCNINCRLMMPHRSYFDVKSY